MIAYAASMLWRYVKLMLPIMMQHKHEKDVPVPREGDNNFLEIIKKKKQTHKIYTQVPPNGVI